MIVEQMLMGATSEGGYSPNAVKFDGANDYLTRGGDLTGIADSKSGIFSCWIRMDRPDTTSVIGRLLASLASQAAVIFDTYDGKFRFFAQNVGSVAFILNMSTTNRYGLSPKWYHVLASWDLATAATHIYINDVSDKTTTTATNDTIDYAGSGGGPANYAVGADTSGANKLDAAISELYFAPGQYLDFSNSTNRRKFIDASGLPVDLGSTGATPTGTAPAIYLKGDKTGFGTNSGTGGNFTVNGALEKASTTPATLPTFNAVKFDGVADYLNRAALVGGVSNGTSGIFSAWVRCDADTASGYLLRECDSNANGFAVRALTTTNAVIVSIQAQAVGGTADVLGFTTSVASSPGGASPKWIHILAGWDTAVNTGRLYIDDTLVQIITPATNTLRYAETTVSIGRSMFFSAGYLNGAISELYFAPNQYLDLSVQANREKFILAGAPVSLGSDGSLPTGTAPAIYLPNRAALAGTNAGTGGNFTINGAPKDANSTPVYYYAEPVKFDGTNDYLTRGADLTGIADGNAGTVSFWVRADSLSELAVILGSATGILATSHLFYLNTDGSIALQLLDATNSVIVGITSATGKIATGGVWVHTLASWDTAANTAKLYISNVSSGSQTVSTNTLDYARSTPNWSVGGTTLGTNKLNGAIADLWFNTTYLDLSIQANRAKFIDQTTLRPVPLGAKGELPTGSQPLLYLGRDYSNFQTNLGSGGNFTVTGALDRGTTSPSDVRA